jgi:putative Holliday junction resolvase
MRLLALDVGGRRIGIAVSDALGFTARPHSTIERNRSAIPKIAQLAKELEVKRVVIGLPLHLNGREGEQAADVRTFAGKLASALDLIPIEFWDERFSTVEASELQSRQRRKQGKKKDIDAIAAAVILESYLREKGR